MKKINLLFLFLLLLFVCNFLFSWSDCGHEIIARIAVVHLNKKVLDKINAILPNGMNMIDVSTWADKIKRQRPNTEPWHYVDFPIRENVTLENISKYYNDNSIIPQLEKEIKQLKDSKTEAKVKQEDLMFLIHFVGDIHMPLHCSNDNDRGGNLKIVHVQGKRNTIKTNLHHYWDEILSAYSMTQDDIDKLGNELSHSITDTEYKTYASGDPKDWAFESYTVSKKYVYINLPVGEVEITLLDNYNDNMMPIAKLQLQKQESALHIFLILFFLNLSWNNFSI